MKSNIFREYDIRGIIGDEFCIDKAYDLSCAIVTYLKQKHPDSSTIVIGRDGRTHSLKIQQEIMSAAVDLGLDVIDIGLCPTPTVYFAVHFFKTPLALAITASHNPKEYNGIKMWGVWGNQIQEIRKIYESHSFYENNSGKKGTLRTHDMVTNYIDYLCNHFSHLKNASLNAVIDCGNGSAGTVMPELIKKMNWTNVKLLFEDVDGNFPNHEADPTCPENMEDVLHALQQNPDLTVGIGFDGDCDRMNPMTKSGELVAGDKMLAIFAQKVLKTHPKAAVVFDIKSSSSLIEILKKWDAKPCIAPSGHSLIKKAMVEHNALLAGELSCHFFFHDRYFGYDDGIYAALRLFEILQETKQMLEDLLQIFPKRISSPEIRIKCNSDAEKVIIVDHVKKIFAARKDSEIITIDGIRAQTSYGWGLVRASNTQPVICLRFESDTKEGLQKIKEDFYLVLSPHFDSSLREKIAL